MKSVRSLSSLSAVEAAPLLLGWVVCRDIPKGTVKLRIVETEAYHQDDLASHSHRGFTKRTAPMFEAGGRLYVYFSYGVHYAINIVTGPKGAGEAVLLRAAEPIDGIRLMMKNRKGITDIHKLANGPGKLAQSLGVKSTKLSGQLLNKSTIYLEPPILPVPADRIAVSPRIGITKNPEPLWRFFLKENLFVSKSVYNKK